jgi:O-antigen/teichoic acid export membrane protein
MKGGDAPARRGDLTVAALIIGLRGGMLIAKFLLALFIARFIGLDELGIYGLISGATAVLQVVVRCGVFAKLSRDAVHNELPALTIDLRHYWSGVLTLYALLAPAACVVGWYFAHPQLALHALAVVISEHVISDVVALMTNLDRPGFANVLYALQSAAWVYLFMALAFMLPGLRELEWVLVFWIAGGVLALAIAAQLTRSWPWRAAFNDSFQWSWFARNVRASWRLYISEVVAVLTLYADRYLLTLFLPLEQVGVFVLFWQMASAIGNLVGAGVLQVYRARLIRAGRSDDAAAFQSLYRESLSRGLAAGVLLSLAAAPAAFYLITFSKQPLAMGYLPLLGLMLACLQIRIWADAAKNAAYTRQQDQWVMSSNLLSLLTGVALSFALIPVYGLYGVIGPMAAAQAIIIVFLALKSARPLPEHSA